MVLLLSYSRKCTNELARGIEDVVIVVVAGCYEAGRGRCDWGSRDWKTRHGLLLLIAIAQFEYFPQKGKPQYVLVCACLLWNFVLWNALSFLGDLKLVCVRVSIYRILQAIMRLTQSSVLVLYLYGTVIMVVNLKLHHKLPSVWVLRVPLPLISVKIKHYQWIDGCRLATWWLFFMPFLTPSGVFCLMLLVRMS